MCIKLYETDSYIKEFEATVISWDGNGAILDRTAFFPEGGGQYGDTGYIGGVRVVDTQIKDGVIYHITEAPVDTGRVSCTIDWNVRFNRMQNHSGEHILSGVIHERFGYNNVGFHLNDEDVTLDVDEKLTHEDVNMLEVECNRIIDEDIKISVLYPSSDELKNLDYRSKLDLRQGVRIVKIGDIDMCACCAPHVSATAQIGLLKIIKFYNYKGGTRLHILCGNAARKDYRVISDMNTLVVNTASAKRYELEDVFHRMESEISVLKEEIKALRHEMIDTIISSEKEGESTHLYLVNGYGSDDLIRLCDVSVKRFPEALSVALCGNDDEGYNFAIGGKDGAEKFADFKRKFNVRGGGRDIYCGKAASEKNELFSYFECR